MTWVLAHSPYTGAKFALHLCVADTVNDEYGQKFWMSPSKLARKARTTRETASRWLWEAADAGFLRVIEDHRGERTSTGQGLPSLFRFLTPPMPKVYDFRRVGGAPDAEVEPEYAEGEPLVERVTTDHVGVSGLQVESDPRVMSDHALDQERVTTDHVHVTTDHAPRDERSRITQGFPSAEPNREAVSTSRDREDREHASAELDLGLPETPAKAKRQRPSDPTFEAVRSACYPAAASGERDLTKTERGHVNKAVAELKATNVEPDEIDAAAAKWHAEKRRPLAPTTLVTWIGQCREDAYRAALPPVHTEERLSAADPALYAEEFKTWIAGFPTRGEGNPLGAYARRRAEGHSAAALEGVKIRALAAARRKAKDSDNWQEQAPWPAVVLGRDFDRWVTGAEQTAVAAGLGDRPRFTAADGGDWSTWLRTNLGGVRPAGAPPARLDMHHLKINTVERDMLLIDRRAVDLVPAVKDPAVAASYPKLAGVCWLPLAWVEWLLSPWCDVPAATAAAWLAPFNPTCRDAFAERVTRTRLERLAAADLSGSARSWWDDVVARSTFGSSEDEAEFLRLALEDSDGGPGRVEHLVGSPVWERWLAHVERRVEVAA